MKEKDLKEMLLGAWRIIRTVNAGEEQEREEDEEHFLWFMEDIIVTGDEWAAWDMPYELKSDQFPMKIDVKREDLNESFIDKGLLSISDDELILCMAGDESKTRPGDLSSTLENGHTLYVGIRSDEPVPA